MAEPNIIFSSLFLLSCWMIRIFMFFLNVKNTVPAENLIKKCTIKGKKDQLKNAFFQSIEVSRYRKLEFLHIVSCISRACDIIFQFQQHVYAPYPFPLWSKAPLLTFAVTPRIWDGTIARLNLGSPFAKTYNFRVAKAEWARGRVYLERLISDINQLRNCFSRFQFRPAKN